MSAAKLQGMAPVRVRCELSAPGLLRDSGHLGDVLRDVVKELGRQDRRFGWPRSDSHLVGFMGNWTPTSEALAALEPLCRKAIKDGEHTWPAILGEEVGELGNAPNPFAFVAEARQVAAVAISIVMHAEEFFGLTAEMDQPYAARPEPIEMPLRDRQLHEEVPGDA